MKAACLIDVIIILVPLVSGLLASVRSQLPKDVSSTDYTLTRIIEHTARTHSANSRDVRHISFAAFGSNFHLRLRRFNGQGSKQELPVLIIDKNGTETSVYNFTKMGVEFYYDENTNGAFAIQMEGIDPRTFTIEGVINKIEEDIVIEPARDVHRKARSKLGYILHLVYRRRHLVSNKVNGHIQTVKSLPPQFHVLPVSGHVNATVEILAWADLSYQKAFQHLSHQESEEMAILKYIATIIHAGNIMYKHGIRDNSLNINLVLTSAVICKDPNMCRFTYSGLQNGSIDNYVALDNFATALTNVYNQHKLTFKYDYAVAFTRLDLSDSQGDPLGVSFTNDICQISNGKSSSIIEDRGGYSCIGTFVHELAHTLGSDHDGWYRGRECPPSEGYIMASLSPLTKNGFYFSQCSINSMKKNLMQSNASCVLDQPYINQNYQSLVLEVPGQAYNTTAQCQELYGTNFCLSIGTTLEDICYKMYCWDPVLPNVCSTKSPAAPGTSCGPKKWCFEGECIYNKNAP